MLYPCSPPTGKHAWTKQEWFIVPVKSRKDTYTLVTADHLWDRNPRAIANDVTYSGGPNATHKSKHRRPNESITMVNWIQTSTAQMYEIVAA